MSVTVYFRKDRMRWCADYYIGGKRKRPLFLEEAEARNHARKIHLGLAPEDRDSITIRDAGVKYFETESKRKSPKSRSNDKRYINLMFHFMTYERGLERLKSIVLEDMEAFRDWLPRQTEFDDKPMSMGPKSVNRCLAVLGHFFKKHIHWKNIAENPCQYLEKLEAEDNERAAMSEEQYQQMLAFAPAWLKSPLQFMRLTGAPAICVERLDFQDLEMEKRRYSILRKKGKRARWKRTHFQMTNEVYSLFQFIRSRTLNTEGPVFRDAEGRPLLADRVTREGNAAIKAAGIKGVTLYGLRHALASDLTTANVATEIVRQAMGHASIQTTQRYANKIGSNSIKGAIESVRGDQVVTIDGSALRIGERSFSN